MPARLFIGLMSGTSVDAIDAALVRITTNAPGHYKANVLHHLEHPWPTQLRQRLLQIMAPARTTTEELCQLNVLVAHEFAAAVEKLLKQSNTHRKKIAALGSHGQTTCHLPPTNSKRGDGENRKSKIPGTLQLGDPSVISTLTRITTVGNFRPADMALGGQGAPLVPWTDAALLSHPTKTRCIQNIGGIANVTYLPPLQEKNRRVLAFDTGPGNMLIDALLFLHSNGKHRFDQNGQLAAKGHLDETLFRQLQSHPYFQLPPPKSTGRELFGQQLARRLLTRIKNQKSKIENLLHTATRLTAWSIADAYARFLPQMPDELILCGGGADNPTLVRMLQEELATIIFPHRSPSLSEGSSPSRKPGIPPAQAAQVTSPTKALRISRIDDYGIPNKAKEAASFALLAAATLDRIPANLPSVTGAARPTLLGLIAPQ
jgi:anhydro-N-acetylmuramic acid kinase